MADATFEEGADKPLALKAETAEDLAILSAMVQDAVLPIGEMQFDRKRHELALLINRFRWEDQVSAEARGRAYERVRAILRIGGALAVASQGIDRKDADTILSILSLGWEPGEDGAGRLVLMLAGDGAIAVTAECLDVSLRDVTRPYAAPSGKAPRHPD